MGILLSAHHSQYALTAGRWVCAVVILVLMINAAYLSRLLGDRRRDAADDPPGLLRSGRRQPLRRQHRFSSLRLHHEALAAFGIGVFLAHPDRRRDGTPDDRRPLPPIIVPSFSAFLAAAATASVAWIVAHPGPMGDPQYFLMGVLLMMILIQLVFVEDYRKLPFSFSFWLFAFPVGVTGSYSVRWFAASGLEQQQRGPGSDWPWRLRLWWRSQPEPSC